MTPRGLSATGLDRLHAALAAHVDAGSLPGLIALVARHDSRRTGTAHLGDAHVDVIGTRAFGDRDPMPRDAVFRIASLTKPIVAAAAMTLVDDGVLGRDTTVDEYLPELAGRRVLRHLGAALDDTVAARRAITLDDLLTFRLGFGTVMAPPDTYPIQRAERDLELGTLGAPWPPTPHTPDEWIRRLGSLPLMYQPGERWLYNTGSQVLGVLLERVAGRPLEAFLRERLFEPLGMRDTGFSVSPEQRPRFTTAYTPGAGSRGLSVLDGIDDSYWRHPPALPNAAGWLVSTIDDFWAFVSMLLDDGAYYGVRILTERSVRLMTTNRLTTAQRASATEFLGGGGWGFGMRTPGVGAAGAVAAIPGGFGWDGGTGTTWRTDRERGITGILLSQLAMTSPDPPPLFVDFWHAAYRSTA